MTWLWCDGHPLFQQNAVGLHLFSRHMVGLSWFPVSSCRCCACGDPARVGAQSLRGHCQVRRRSGFACVGPTGLSGARVRVDVFCVPSDRPPSRFTGVGWPLDLLFSLGCAFGRATASKKPRGLFLTRLNDALPVTIQLTFKLSGAFTSDSSLRVVGWKKEALSHERYLFGQGVILRLAIGTTDGGVHTEDLADSHGWEFAGMVRRHSRRVVLRGVSRTGPLNRQRLPHQTLDRGCCGGRGDTTSGACRSQNAAKLGAGWRRRSLPMRRSSGTPPSTHVRGLLCRSEAYRRPTHAQ